MTVARSFFGAPRGLSLTVAMFSMYLARFLTLDMSWYPPVGVSWLLLDAPGHPARTVVYHMI